MSKINLAGVQASSGLSGLLYVDTVNVSQLFSINIPAPQGTTVTETVNIPFPSSEVLSIINFNTSGSGESSIDDYWWPLIGIDQFVLPIANNSYIITLSVQSAANGRNVVITFINDLNNAPVSISAITFNFTAYLYSYPF